ncbi:MAG: VanW family protein [Clostridia bacterium]|nr:VanW family protein [Clostridia bacterium]
MEKLENNLPTKNEAQGEIKNVDKSITQTETLQEKTENQISVKKNTENSKDISANFKKSNKKDTTEKKDDKGKKIIDKKEVEEFFKERKSSKKDDKSNTDSKKGVDETMQLKKLKNKKLSRKKIIISLIIVSALLISILSTAFGIRTSFNDKIISGVSINGVDISNLTKSEALSKLATELKDDFNKDIVLSRGEYSSVVNANSIEARYNLEDSVESAYSIGRSGGNIFSNNFTIINSLLNKTNITPPINYNVDLLNEKFDEIDSQLPDKAVNSNYKIEDNKLIISSGTDGYRINRKQLKDTIYSALAGNNLNIEIPVEQYHTDDVNIDAIYDEVYKEPVDATFNVNPYELHKEENGLDFAISLDEARAMVADRQETYTIPLKVLKPKVTVRSLPQEAFPDQLATYSTTYASSNYNRSTNISLAASSVNGWVLMPGETFSYNGALGQRTAARGYREAGAYVNGQVSTEVGGGICQVSSTLYNATLLCNLEIVARTNHTFEPSYVPAGQDATVSWQSPDFKFKNNREYPIKVIASAGSGRISVTIYGVKSSDDYEVKIQSSKTGSIPFSTEYVDDNSMPAGTTRVTRAGSNGCKSVTYKILYKDGQEVSRTLINSDTYKPHNQVIAKGTKVVQESSPKPTPDSEPTPSNDSDDNDESTDESSVTITNEQQ